MKLETNLFNNLQKASSIHRVVKLFNENINFLFFVILLHLLFDDLGHAEFFLHGWYDEYRVFGTKELRNEIRLFKTESNYDQNGVAQIPPDFQQVSRFQDDIFFHWGFKEHAYTYLRLSWARIQLDHNSRGGTAFGFADQSLGAGYRLLERKDRGDFLPLAVDLQIQYDLPLYNNVTAETKRIPYLGDSSADLTFGAFVLIPIFQRAQKGVDVVIGSGYTYRNGGFSAAIPWSLKVQYNKSGEGFSFSAGVRSFISLNTDERGKNPTLSSSSSGSLGTGGSFISNAINPNLTNFESLVSYQTKYEFLFFAGFSRSVSGKRAPQGNQFIFGLEVQLGRKDESHGNNSIKQSKFSHLDPLEARVLQTNDRLNLVKIDKGESQGIEVGQVFDIFKIKSDGSADEIIARGKVNSVHSGESVLLLIEYFKEIWIEEGFIAKRLNQ